jgi:predicted RNase H-like HicB family nuclease
MTAKNNLNPNKYHIIVQRSPEGGYSGQCLELAGAISEGETEEELIKNMTEAIQLVLEPMQERAKANKERIIEVPIETKLIKK